MLDLRPRGGRFEPQWLHSVVSLSKNINPSLELVQPRKTFITERLLMGSKINFFNSFLLLIGEVGGGGGGYNRHYPEIEKA